MPTILLTDVVVKALKPSATYVTYWCTKTPAFGLRVGKRTKTWTVMRGRNRERVSIGRYPDLPLAEARAEAKRLLSAEAQPRSVKKLFRDARDEFLEAHYADKSEGTKYQVSRSLKAHFTILEHMQLGDIDDADVKRCLDKLKDRPSEQLHAFRYLRTFFNWCVRAPRRYARFSPLTGYEPPGKDKRKTRILSDEEIRAVWEACTKPSDAAVRVMLLFGTRRGETCVLERSWAFQEVLTIPGEHTKNGRAHAIPICPLAAHILPSHNYAHFFPGRWGDGHLTPRGLSQVVTDVQKRSSTSGWTPHDLRRTFRSLAARVGVSRDLAELLMNHAPKVLDDIYDQYSYLREKRDALLKIEAALVWLLVRT